MFIQTEQTPNPNSLKFIPGQVVMETGTADFRNAQDATTSPMAQRLFTLQGVEGVFLGHDFISITKDPDTDWAVMKPLILGAIMDHLTSGLPIYDASKEQSDIDMSDELNQQIVELLDTRVRPAVARDGGDIQFAGFENGVVLLRMQGACAGCPSSTLTLKAGVENMLRHYIPEIQEVRAVE